MTARQVPSTDELLVVGRRARWARARGATVDLSGHPSLRRILWSLCEADARGTPMTTAQLLSVGWPGESPDVESGANRVYVAISTLRRMGLRGVIVRRGGGYALASRVVVSGVGVGNADPKV